MSRTRTAMTFIVGGTTAKFGGDAGEFICQKYPYVPNLVCELAGSIAGCSVGLIGGSLLGATYDAHHPDTHPHGQ